MAEDTKDGESGQDTAAKPDAITAERAATGVGTATGREAIRRQDETEGGRATETGHDDEIEGAHADYLGEGKPPVGTQTEPSMFVSNGAIQPNMVPSPSGPVPISTVARSQEHANQINESRTQQISDSYNNTSARQRITDEKLARMTRAEIAAVAFDRGYDISSAAGGRATRSLFKAAQDKDQDLEDGENHSPTAVGSGPIEGVDVGATAAGTTTR